MNAVIRHGRSEGGNSIKKMSIGNKARQRGKGIKLSMTARRTSSDSLSVLNRRRSDESARKKNHFSFGLGWEFY